MKLTLLERIKIMFAIVKCTVLRQPKFIVGHSKVGDAL